MQCREKDSGGPSGALEMPSLCQHHPMRLGLYIPVLNADPLGRSITLGELSPLSEVEKEEPQRWEP